MLPMGHKSKVRDTVASAVAGNHYILTFSPVLLLQESKVRF